MKGRIIGTNNYQKCKNLNFGRGQCVGFAYTTDNHECPSETGPTWKYSDGGWLDAWEGLLIDCYNSTCSLNSPCSNGRGDCDHHTDCEGALLCGNDNCASGPTGMDCCTDDGN